MLSTRLGAVPVCRAGCASETALLWLQGFAAGIVFRGQSPAAPSPAPCSGAALGCAGDAQRGMAVPRCHRDTECSQGLLQPVSALLPL